jgi:hypothetical protein
VGGQPLSEVGDGSLCAGVRGNLGQRNVGIHGRNVQDVAGLLCDHVLGKHLGGQ